MELSLITLRMVNGTQLSVASQSEETRLFLKPQEKSIFQSQELKFTLLNALEMVVVACQQ